jgi:hypothetical protein
LPSQSDDSNHLKTLPLPELNPLLNPLLGENMGRWAEVYFRNPPENREQAVLQLLQELESENAQHASVISRSSTQEHAAVSQRSFTSVTSAEAPSPIIRCRSCGHENLSEQRFCGMCGVPLVSESLVDGPPVQDPEDAGLMRRESNPAVMSATDEIVSEPQFAHEFSGVHRKSEESDWSSDGLIRSLEYGRGPKSYRMYIGAVLAMIVLALGYIAWKNGQGNRFSQLSTPAPPSTPTQPAEQTPTPSAAAKAAPKVDTPEHNVSKQSVSEQSASEQAAESASNQHGPNTDVEKVTPAALLMKEAALKKSQDTGGNGSEELAIAKSYLNGGAGQQANSAEAVDWLWKAVAKRNAEATLLLSDLYLRGNGIPKNCDQARVLLDAAASRGIKDAAIRLRNMQTFGCE